MSALWLSSNLYVYRTFRIAFFRNLPSSIEYMVATSPRDYDGNSFISQKEIILSSMLLCNLFVRFNTELTNVIILLLYCSRICQTI